MLADFVSPVFFEVVPTIAMAGVFARIGRDFANQSQFKQVVGAISDQLSASLSLTMMAPADAASGEFPRVARNFSTKADKTKFGEMVLQLYFAQIFRCDTNILDLRSSAFKHESIWCPAAIYYRWSDDFREGIRKMYWGFYHDDQTVFLSGLSILKLEYAADIFRSHFGVGMQSAVTFRLAEFKKSFHAIFLRCKEHKTKLHPDFFALGVYLVCLYENLESLGVPLNVRDAFLRAEVLS